MTEKEAGLGRKYRLEMGFDAGSFDRHPPLSVIHEASEQILSDRRGSHKGRGRHSGVQGRTRTSLASVVAIRYNEFVNTTSTEGTLTPRERGFRMPAEWEGREATLMAWPVRAEAWLDGLDEARDGFVEVANAISGFERVIMIARGNAEADGYSPFKDARKRLSSAIEVWDLPHDDSWLRDNGPTFLLDEKGGRCGIDWRFNAWGRKYEPYDADDRLASLVLRRMETERVAAPLVLEGGSIHTDGEGTLLVTEECLLARNRNPDLSKADIEDLLREYLGVDTFIWLDRGLAGDETDGHVDNLACFVRPGLIAVQVTSDPEQENYANSARNLAILAEARDYAGRRPQVLKIEQPPARSCRGERLTLSYVNYYPVSGGLVIPVFGRDGDSAMRASDERALSTLREAYPGRKTVAIDGLRIIKGGGNVHCITQQIPAPRRLS